MVAVSLKKYFFQAEDGIRDISIGDWSSDVCSSDLIAENNEKEITSERMKEEFMMKTVISTKNAPAAIGQIGRAHV